MPLKLVKGKTFPIGVDIGSGCLKLAQLRQAESGYELLAAGSLNVPRAARGKLYDRLGFLSSALPTVLKTTEFHGRQCVLSLPAASTFVHHLQMPKVPPENLISAIQMELQGKLPCPVEDAVIRHVQAGDIMGDGEPKQEVIVAAVARSVLEAYLSICRRAGLDVVGVNIEACAVVECFAHLFRRVGDQARTIMFIDLGASSTQVVLSQGEKLVFARNLFRGEDQLDAAIAKGLGVPMEQAHSMRLDLVRTAGDGSAARELYRCIDHELDALCDELTQCLRYYETVFRGQSVERTIFVGGQAYDKQLCQLIAQRLNVPAQVGDPLMRIKRIGGAGLCIGLDRREPQPDWAVAVGLSLGAGDAAA